MVLIFILNGVTLKTSNYKAGSNIAPGGKYPLQDLNSAARATRLVRRFSLEFLEGQCLFSQDTIQDEPSPELAETFSNKVTSAWQNRQETADFTRFSCKRLPATIVRPWLLWVRVCRFISGSNYISNDFESFALWRSLRTCKRTRTFAFFSSTTWNRYTVIRFYIYNLQKQNSRSRTASTNFKTETQTCRNRTTSRLLRDLLNFSWQRVDSNQLEIINGKKRFSLVTLLRINLSS